MVSRQRLFRDLCESFDIIVSKQNDRDPKGKKQRTDIEAIIKERNSKFKEIQSNIQTLSFALNDENWLQILDNVNVQTERHSCELLDNNFENLQVL